MRAFFLACCLVAGAPAAETIPSYASADLARLPVLHQGRVKPLAVACDEIVLAITGKTGFGLVVDDESKKQSPEHLRLAAPMPAVDVVLDLLLNAEVWRNRPLVHVPYLPLREQLGLRGQWASVAQLSMPEAGALLRAAAMKQMRRQQSGEAVELSAMDEEAAAVGARVLTTQAVMAGNALQLSPLLSTAAERTWFTAVLAGKLRAEKDGVRPWRTRALDFLADIDRLKGEDPWRMANADIWLDLDDLVLHPDPLLADWPGHAVCAAAAAWKMALLSRRDQMAPTQAFSAGLRARGEANVALRGLDRERYFAKHPEARDDPTLDIAVYPSDASFALELWFDRARPFICAMIAFFLGGILTAIGLGRAARRGRPSRCTKVGVALTVVGILLTATGIVVRSLIAGFGPVTNLYGTFVWVALVSSVLGLVLSRATGKGSYAVVAGIAAGLCALVGNVIPPDYRQIEQLQPVLRSQYWLVVHVMTEVASYGAFLVAWLLGNIVLWGAWRRRQRVANDDAAAIYRSLQVGVVLVAAGTLLGAVWADKAWGRFWGWDPKEVWALVTFLTYLVPLHLRYAGMVGPTGLAAWSVLGFLSVVMSWWGVNFFIGAGLHAYATGHGFGTFTTDQLWVFIFSGAQAMLTIVQIVAIRRATNMAAILKRAADASPVA